MGRAGAAGVYAVVLAAGSGSRFGGPKLLAPLGGRPLVAHVATTVAEAIARGILVGAVAVIPARNAALARSLEMTGLRLVENPEAASGIASSVRRGIAALEESEDPPAGAALMVLADQPRLSVEVIARLVEEWRRTGGSVRPRYAADPSAPGHPVLVARSRWHLARTLTGDRGLGPLLERAPEGITEIDVAGTNPDVDSTEDLSALEDPGP